MKTNEEIVEELDSLANIYGWHHGNCAGHSHHPSCPVVKLRHMFITTLEAKDKECEERVREERERIETIFKKHVPPHALSLEDGVWLKRLLNKAFGHDKKDN